MKEVQLYKYAPTGIILVGVVDDFISLSFPRSFSQVGEWQMVLPANTLSAALLQDADIIRLAPGVAGWITKPELKNDSSQSTLTVSGVELKGIAANRVVVPPAGSAYFNVNNTPEYVIAQLLGTQLIAPTDTKRAILGSVAAYSGSANLHKDSYRYSNLKDEIEAIAVAYGVGWYADVEGGQIVFHIVHGVDRSAGQTANSRIVLSYANDNILQSTLSEARNLPETAIVAGQGEGESREIYIVGDDKEGLQRKELFVDARDITDNTLLEGRGLEKLAAFGSGIAYECTLSPAFARLYRQAYDIGDQLTIQDETLSGGALDAALTAVTEVYEAGDVRIDVALGYDANTISGVLSRISDSTESLINTDTITRDVITTLETQITQMNGFITLKADKTVTDTLGDALENKYSELKLDADGMSLRVGSTEGTIAGIQDNVGVLNDFKATQEVVFRIDEEGAHVGRSTDKTGVLVSPEKVSLTDSAGSEGAWLTNSKLFIPNAEITNNLQIAKVQFVSYPSGRVALKKV